jgi:hypothetical protein
MSGRAAKRNTQGGKAFKSKAKGEEGFRAKAAREAANEMLDIVLARENGYKGLNVAEKAQMEQAQLELQVGRVTRKFGNARFEVYCQDGKLRNCALRGLLKRKGQCFVDIDALIAVTLSEPLETMDSSDDEGHYGGGSAAIGASYRSQSDQGFIVGIFDAAAAKALRKTRINPRLFMVQSTEGEVIDDLFDRSEEGDAPLEDALASAAGGKKSKKKGSSDDVNLEDL